MEEYNILSSDDDSSDDESLNIININTDNNMKINIINNNKNKINVINNKDKIDINKIKLNFNNNNYLKDDLKKLLTKLENKWLRVNNIVLDFNQVFC